MRPATNAKIFDGAVIQLFADLSWRTLQQRRALQPLLQTLLVYSLRYHWGFPFSLSVTKEGRTLILHTSDKICTKSREVNIPCPETPGWEPIPENQCAAELWLPAQRQKWGRCGNAAAPHATMGMN